jgi:hypothetical protein
MLTGRPTIIIGAKAQRINSKTIARIPAAAPTLAEAILAEAIQAGAVMAAGEAIDLSAPAW